jgi:hypothetical protein
MPAAGCGPLEIGAGEFTVDDEHRRIEVTEPG